MSPSALGAALAAALLPVLVGCQREANDRPVLSTSDSGTTPPPLVEQRPPPEHHYTKFKVVTSAKPAEVEAAMGQGWHLVNCAVAMRENPSFTATSIIVDHCYFEGDEHAVAVDGGTGSHE